LTLIGEWIGFTQVSTMIIDLLSDLHGQLPILPGGDLLVVAGDLTSLDRAYQFMDFEEWIKSQKYEKKVVIGGNHDALIESGRWTISPPNDFEYLQDSGTRFRDLKIWGSPWTTKFENQNPHAMAFAVDTEQEMGAKFDLIPEDIDLLITHSPPFGILDKCSHGRVGSLALRAVVERVRPRLHVFGHIHESAGCNPSSVEGVTFVNCAVVDGSYSKVRNYTRIEL